MAKAASSKFRQMFMLTSLTIFVAVSRMFARMPAARHRDPQRSWIM
jgi:hypothetical protein